jgi:hypothetical protein
MERCTIVDGVTYAWREYLLHTRHGYWWLLEDSGHWTLVQPANPAEVRVEGTHASYQGRKHKLFSTANTIVRFVIGEFYWKVEVGERAQAADYISPPYILSEERTTGEMQWSAGEYVEAHEVWEAFGLPDEPPKPYDVAPAQPNPVKVMPWLALGVVFALLLAGVFFLTKKNVPIQTLVDGPIQMPVAPEAAMAQAASSTATAGAVTAPNPSAGGPSVQVSYTPPFQVPSGAEALKVAMTSDLGHGWLGVAFALIDQSTGVMTEFTLEEERVHAAGSAQGRGATSQAVLGNLQPGTYVLRIDPRWARKSGSLGETTAPAANLRVSTTNPEDNAGCCCIAMCLILLPIPFSFLRKRLFESRRWRNSNLV